MSCDSLKKFYENFNKIVEDFQENQKILIRSDFVYLRQNVSFSFSFDKQYLILDL